MWEFLRMTEFRKGDRVQWKSHGGEAVGTVERKHRRPGSLTP